MVYDCIIVGAGAAGIMTAITAGRGGLKVLLLEGQAKVGAKILMSGGTRCNVTNKAVSEKDYNSEKLMTVRNILRGFDNEDARKFFEELGVELLLEPTGKYFPSTNKAKSVLDALLRAVDHAGVDFRASSKVTQVTANDGVFTVISSGVKDLAKSVVLTTGGLSYPSTGSDGLGYRLGQSFGHDMVATSPALTPLTTDDSAWKSLAGISLSVRLTLWVDGRKKVSFEDGFLIAHFGFSGPAALDISRHWVSSDGRSAIHANFLPAYDEGSFEEYLLKAQRHNPKRQIRNVVIELLPERLAMLLLSKARVDGNLLLNQLPKDARRKLVMHCVNYPLAINGVVGYSKAEVTSGGIDLAQVNPKTLESHYQPGLYFAGEILDVDGRIGGFNFQWSWASGHAVGNAIIKRTERDHS